MSDKKTQTILVGMTGRLDSTVSAYLLKKQGHRVLGVGVMWPEGELEKKLFSPWELPNINEVKKICDHLDIPFYGVHGHEIFQANVVERLVSSRLSGEVFCFPSHLHQTLIEVLLAKAEKLNADAVATGHYAKLTRNQTTGQYGLLMASDPLHDQSFLLAQLKQEQLSKLIFPLAEVRREQAKKIEALFNFKLFPPVKRPKELDAKTLANFVEANSAEVFHKEGIVQSYREENIFGDHPGVHYYRLGQSQVYLKDGVSIDSNLRVVAIDAYSGDIFIDEPSEISVDTVVLTELKIDGKWDVSRPVEVYVEAGLGASRCAATMLLKNNKLVVLTYHEIQKDFVPTGQQVVVYDAQNTGARVVASGRVLKSGLMTERGIEVIPRPLEDDQNINSKGEEKKRIRQKGYEL